GGGGGVLPRTPGEFVEIAKADRPIGAAGREDVTLNMKPNSVAVVGLGYVGLPLSLQFARSGLNVLGLDIDDAKVKAINAGKSYIKHIEGSAIAEQVNAKRFEPSTDFSRVKEVEA